MENDSTGTEPVPQPESEPVCIRQDTAKTLHLAKWLTRFWAWLIDVILIILFLNIVRGILEPIWTIHFLWDWQHWGLFEIGSRPSFLPLLDDNRELQRPVNRQDGDEISG